MGLIPESYMEPLQWFSEKISTDLHPAEPNDAQVVQKGLLLYRQGSVSNLKLEDNAVTGVVQDVTPARVRLNLDIPSFSKCSCPTEGMCRHQMATFFQVLSHAGSVSEWVEAWRRPLQQQKQAKTWGIQRAKDLLKTTGQLKADYQTWTDSFRESFDSILLGKGNPTPYLVGDLYSIYYRRLKAGAPYEQEWKNLYLLIGSVISFKKLIYLSIELEHDEDTINRYYRHIFQNILDDVEETSERFSVQSVPFAFDEFIEKLKEETLELLEVDFEMEYDRVHLFRVLWTELFKRKDWREEMLEELSAVSRPSFAQTVGLIHLHILRRNDDAAFALIQAQGEELTPYFFYWLELFSFSKEWKRMERYVVEFITRIKSFLAEQRDYFVSKQFMKMATDAIAPFCVETNRLDIYERSLVQMLPYSFSDYEGLLFDKKEYDKWMELHTYVGFDFSMVSKDQLKILQNEAPMMLLPLYHQAIQKDLDGKNREYYRQAVRKLKKLRTLYKKLKRVDEWETFLDRLLTRTKRLRAFHEECKRGKLIDA